MRTFFAVLKNNYRRTAPRIAVVILITAVTLASIFIAVYVTRIQQVKGHIALITQNDTEGLPGSSAHLDITAVSEKPPRSDLVKQKYDAFVTVNADGQYAVETLRSDDYKDLLLYLLADPDADVPALSTDRGAGVNIIGFMMMFLLMFAFANLFAFADDKEQGQLRRIAASPASFGGYLAAHCVYCLSLLLPEFLLLAVLKGCGWDIGFSLWQYAYLMAVLGFFGISFALLLHTLIRKPDNANMLGNAVMVLTSVLAGGFYSFSKSNAVVDHILKLLPQKQFMDFAQYLQNGSALSHMGPLLYVVAFALVLFLFSCAVLRGMYVKKV